MSKKVIFSCLILFFFVLCSIGFGVFTWWIITYLSPDPLYTAPRRGYYQPLSADFATSNRVSFGLESMDTNDSVHNIAVFLLGTMNPGYYERSVAARKTWGAAADIFYMVTGASSSESNKKYGLPSCHNRTKQYRSRLQPFLQTNVEVYACGENTVNQIEEIPVLHLPDCLGTYWGAEGPCCRCEGAMLFYLALANEYSSRGESFPSWFIFSDDDYFTRLHYLETMLAPYTALDKAYALVSSSGLDEMYLDKQQRHSTKRVNFGLFQKAQGTCTVPCIHRVPWMGWGGFSLAALQNIQSLLEGHMLERTCLRWGVTHDVGLGIFVWMNSIPVMNVPMGEHIQDVKDLDSFKFDPYAVHWHRPLHISYDELIEIIWKYGKNKYIHDTFMDTLVNQTHTSKTSISFHTTLFIQQERTLAKLHRINDTNFIYPNGFFQNTYFYRRIKYLHTILSLIDEDTDVMIQKSNHQILDYLPTNCQEDQLLFQAWETQQKPWNTSRHDLHGVYINQPKECVEYCLYVGNKPVNIDDFHLPPSILEKIKHRRILELLETREENSMRK